MFTSLSYLVFFTSTFAHEVQGLCGDSIRWSHHFDMDDVYGLWYGVGYAQHTPDRTNKPDTIGCVSLYITDVTNEYNNDWREWTMFRNNYTDQNWRSYKSNPWSGDSLAGSWLDVRLRRNVKRDIYQIRRVRVLWDEDGQTMEQVYLYYTEAPGLWTAEKTTSWERAMASRGIEVWYPDNPPRHPDVIRILKASPHMLIINHCSEVGSGGIFSLILRRSPSRVERWEWYKYQQEFYNFELPIVTRYTAVCAACTIFKWNIFICDDLSPYLGDINLDEVTGDWDGLEIIPHIEGEFKVDNTNECFHINIKELSIQPNSSLGNDVGVTEKYRIRHLVLEWQEETWQSVYYVKVNTSRKGFWPMEVRNTSVEQMRQFYGGVIQVLRATNDYLVINFCMRLPHFQKFSVLLARKGTQLTNEDLASIHSIFVMKNLSTSVLKRVCENAASVSLSSIILIVVPLIFFIWKFK